ncbi:hypothetical protein D3C71_2116880 [compost metagenome]
MLAGLLYLGLDLFAALRVHQNQLASLHKPQLRKIRLGQNFQFPPDAVGVDDLPYII